MRAESHFIFPFPSPLSDLIHQMDLNLQEPPEPFQVWFSSCYSFSYIPCCQTNHRQHVGRGTSMKDLGNLWEH